MENDTQQNDVSEVREIYVEYTVESTRVGFITDLQNEDAWIQSDVVVDLSK